MNNEKFEAALVYVAEKSKDDPRFGAIKLNKILYYSDFAAYRRLGAPITGDEYQNLPEGPAPRHLVPVQDRLIKSRALVVEERPYFKGVQKRILPGPEPLNAANPKYHLSQGERDVLDEVVQELWALNGKQVSELSHREFGWCQTSQGETIPYHTAWIGSEPLTQAQIEKGVEVAERRAAERAAR